MLTSAVRTSSSSMLPPAMLVSTSGSFEVKPESCSEPITMPASVTMATRSSMVLPVLSSIATIPARVGRVSFWRHPTSSVTATASMPACPASQPDSMSV
jgi:hypothetical protein